VKNAVLGKQAATAAPIESSARSGVSSSAFLAHLAVATRSAAARPHAAALRRSDSSATADDGVGFRRDLPAALRDERPLKSF